MSVAAVTFVRKQKNLRIILLRFVLILNKRSIVNFLIIIQFAKPLEAFG